MYLEVFLSTLTCCLSKHTEPVLGQSRLLSSYGHDTANMSSTYHLKKVSDVVSRAPHPMILHAPARCTLKDWSSIGRCLDQCADHGAGLDGWVSGMFGPVSSFATSLHCLSGPSWCSLRSSHDCHKMTAPLVATRWVRSAERGATYSISQPGNCNDDEGGLLAS